MAKSVKEIESLARQWTETMINVLSSIATSTKSPPASRVAAALGLLDRGWGKPSQTIAGDEENPLVMKIERIERVIIDPANQNGASIRPAVEASEI